MHLHLPYQFLTQNIPNMILSNKKVKLFNTYTDVYYWNKNSTAFINVNQGGTGSSKTISILQNIARECIIKPVKNRFICTVVGQDFPNLESGALRDFKNLIAESPLLAASLVNPKAARGPFRFHSGAILEFKAYETMQDAKNGKREILFINEANGVDYSIAEQLINRSYYKIYIDYNPDAEFWVHEKIVPRKDAVRFISNFTHNPFLPDVTKTMILNWKYESLQDPGNKTKKNRWRVYGLGLTGIVEGTIFTDINYVTYLPPKMTYNGYGLDFGFTNNYTALTKCGLNVYRNSNSIIQYDFYGKELLYKNKLGPSELLYEIDKLHINKKDPIFADPQQEDYIVFLQGKGYNIIPAKKGPNSVAAGIGFLKNCNIHITIDSPNWINEGKMYKYKYDDNLGRFTDEPINRYNDCWSAGRYFLSYLIGNGNRKPKKGGKSRTRRLKVIN